MYRRMRKLCDHRPTKARRSSILDNVAVAVCNPSHEADFYQSVEPPVGRYGLSIDRDLLDHRNDQFPDFSAYGPNEKYIINKITLGSLRFIYVVGGIGVGKTRCLKFIREEVLPRLVHETAMDASKCTVGPIYIDFNKDFSDVAYTAADSIEAILAKRLCTKILARIGDEFFDLEGEIDVVWDELLAQRSARPRHGPANYAIEHIAVRLRDLRAGSRDLDTDRRRVLQVRGELRDQLVSDPEFRLDYTAALARYVLDEYFSGHESCFSLIVDNMDVLPARVQHALRGVLQAFYLNSGITTVITARQTTYYQRFDHAISVLADKVPFCGQTPWGVVDARLHTFLQNPHQFCAGLDPGVIASLALGMKRVRELFHLPVVKDIFEAVCGHSVRKGLILGQFLFNNSSYNPLSIGDEAEDSRLTINDIIRAFLCGTNATYEWSAQSESVVVQNIFQVESWLNQSYLVKLRILGAIKNGSSKGLPVSRLLELLEGFGYRLELIADALDELMLNQKRLVWSDSVLEFEGGERLLEHTHTLLNLSSAGTAYFDTLSKRINYIQEVMLDTSVDVEGMGTGWNYNLLEDRFRLVQEFLRFFFREDCREMKRFCGQLGGDEYEKGYRSRRLLSREMIQQVMDDVRRILADAPGQFLQAHLAVYEDMLNKADYIENVLFNGAEDAVGMLGKL